ncbi:MAG TPA: hypothetical protein VLU25_16270 [Acidobacteriota bacterium]|nr:hypothetical protein [Acidobacteriota bacterium]
MNAHRAAILICLLLSLGLFADALLPSRTLLPAGFLYQRQPWASEHPNLAGDPAQQYDLLYQFYPWALFFRESMLSGQLPLWDPHTYLGTPFWANPQTAVLFPGTWLHLAVPPETSFTLLFMLKAALALTGMFLWLRRRGLPPPASLLGAAVFALSTHTLVSLAFPYSSVSVLFPWALLALDRLLERCHAGPSWGPWAALALACALLVSAGQPQSALAAFLALALFGLLRLLRPPPHWPSAASPSWRHRLRTALLAASAACAGALLCAVQWLPALDYKAEGLVGEGPRIISSGLPYLPGNLLNFLVPDLFGSPLRGDFWGFPGYHDAAFYSSLTALLLAPFAFLRPRSPQGPLFAALLAALSLGIMLGLAPLENLLDLPGLDLIRRNKMAFLAVFALAMMAGQGCHHLTGGKPPRAADRGASSWKLLAAWGVVLLLALWAALLYFQAERLHFSGQTLLEGAPWMALAVMAAGLATLFLAPYRWRGWLLAGLVCGELFLMGYAKNPRGSAPALYPPLPRLRQQLQGELPRLYSTRHTLLAPNSSMVYGLQDVRGYDVMTPRNLFRFMQAIDPSLGDEWTALQALDRNAMHPQRRMTLAFDRALASSWGPALEGYLKSESYWSVTAASITRPHLFNRLNVEWLWTRDGEAPAGYQPVEESGPVRLYRNPLAQPARLFFKWRHADGPQQALQRLQSLQDAETALIESGSDDLAVPAQGQAATDAPPSWDLLERSNQRRLYRVSTPAPALFVEFERHSPGWLVKTDGEERPALRVDSLFRGVLLPPGRHRVEFSYRPASFSRGAILSLLALLLVLGAALAAPSRKALAGVRKSR